MTIVIGVGFAVVAYLLLAVSRSMVELQASLEKVEGATTEAGRPTQEAMYLALEALIAIVDRMDARRCEVRGCPNRAEYAVRVQYPGDKDVEHHFVCEPHDTWGGSDAALRRGLPQNDLSGVRSSLNAYRQKQSFLEDPS